MDFPAHMGFNFTPTIHNDIYPAIDPTKSDLSQPSKVVLITGAGRGIGRSTALRYAECKVASIFICARTTSQLDEVERAIIQIDSNIRVRKIAFDVSDEKAVIAAAETVKKEEGRLDILVNNAGAESVDNAITEGESSSWFRCVDITIKGMYLMLHYFLPLMVETAEKEKSAVHVLNTVSIGVHVPRPGMSAYQTSRFAILKLTDFVAAEYAEKGVNCVAVAPGMVLTDMTKDTSLEAYCIDSPHLCGAFTVWFTKKERTWLNGRYVSVPWDVTELEAMKDEIVREDKLKFRMVV